MLWEIGVFWKDTMIDKQWFHSIKYYNCFNISQMDTEEIQQMFIEMGLGSSEARDKIVRDLSINMITDNDETTYEVKTRSNTLKLEYHA